MSEKKDFPLPDPDTYHGKDFIAPRDGVVSSRVIDMQGVPSPEDLPSYGIKRLGGLSSQCTVHLSPGLSGIVGMEVTQGDTVVGRVSGYDAKTGETFVELIPSCSESLPASLLFKADPSSGAVSRCSSRALSNKKGA
jgi:hypothetical protein